MIFFFFYNSFIFSSTWYLMPLWLMASLMVSFSLARILAMPYSLGPSFLGYYSSAFSFSGSSVMLVFLDLTTGLRL